ncbi:MAG: COX15/CtaA family protein, partial [Methylophilaceae bacterium]
MFKRIAYIATVLTLCVVVLGAYVRLSDAGLGCPDWPGCYGTLTVPQSSEAIEHAQITYPDSPVEEAKAWKEMIHRYLAGILGLFVLALFIQAWCERATINVSPWLPTVLVAVVGFQAVLGMWTVTMLLKPAIVTMHLMGGMTTLAILTWIAHRHWGVISANFLGSSNARFFVRFALVIILLQIFLGGWTSTNYAALACTDFPTCHGAWLPEMDFTNAFHWFRELGENVEGKPMALPAYVAIQWIHRVGALVTFIYLGLLGLRLLKQVQLRGLVSVLLMLLVV